MVERTQSGTFMGGLLRGFQAGESIRQNRQAESRALRQDERDEELHSLQTEATRIEIDSAKAQERRDKALRSLNAAAQAWDTGNVDTAVQLTREGLQTLDMELEDVSPQTAEQLDVLDQALENPDAVDRKQVIAAANRAFRPALMKGPRQVERDGKKLTIIDKRIDEIAPAPAEDAEGNPVDPGIMMRLQVTGRTEDGEEVTWRAPLTVSRSSDPDDPAQSVPIDEISRQVIGRKQLIQGLAASPRFRGIIDAARTRAGGEVESPEYGYEEITEGDEVVTYRTANGQRIAEVGRGPRWKPSERDGAGADDTSELLSGSVLNAIEGAVDRKMSDAFSANGVPVFSDEDGRELATLSNRLGERVYVESGGQLTPNEAADEAMVAVMDARRRARQEVQREIDEDAGLDEETDMIRRRTRELLGLREEQPEPELSERYTLQRPDGEAETVTAADIRETARKHNKTPQQIIDEYELQPAQ